MSKPNGFGIPLLSFPSSYSESTDTNKFILSILYNEGMKERIVSNGHVLIYITNNRDFQIEFMCWLNYQEYERRMMQVLIVLLISKCDETTGQD